jgi:hypothetical protein
VIYSEELIPTISCNALAGISTPQTLKIEGFIKKKKIIVLIDSSSTHNFIHYKLSKALNFFVYPVPKFQVMIVDEVTINCSGKCNKINLTMDNLTMAQNHMKQQVDQHCSERSFEVGDWVFLRLQLYKHISLKKTKKDNKLSPKYYGPYKVLQNIGTMTYKLEFPTSSRVHLIFHVSCLKRVIGDKIPVQTIFPELEEEGKIILEPEAITDTRIL